MNINERLSQIVELKGYTARSFSSQLGVSSQRFSNYLKDRDPDYDTLNRIVETFIDIDPGWLLTGKGEMIKEKSPNEGYPTSQENASTDIVCESLGIKYQAIPKIGNQSSSIPYEFVQSMIDERKRNDEMYAELIRQNGVLVDILKGEIADLKKRDVRQDGSVSDADATKSAI